MSISPAVLRFLDECIDSVPQLETLVLLRAEPGQWWSPADISSRLYSSEESVRAALEGLTRHGLCARRESPPEFRFEVSPGVEALVDEVIRTYQTQLIPVTRIIHLNAASGAREFARAFDLKKDK